MSLGPLIIGVEGTTLSSRDCQRLQHPLVGGVILFRRNYLSVDQLRKLTEQIHALRDPALLIMVDQEGGRVQRFREGFTPYQPLRHLGRYFNRAPQQALRVSAWMGELLSLELLSCGVDVTLAPVLDLDYQHNQVIGDRAFHADPHSVVQLAQAFCQGMQATGFKPVGKHCPGHGYVAGDTHIEKVTDARCLADMQQDWIPFMMHERIGLSGMMLSHVIYQCVDSHPAGFSYIWTEWCRQVLKFRGVLISDDLGMVAARTDRPEYIVQRALNVGLDLLLMCNDFEAIDQVLKAMPILCYADKSSSIAQLRPDRIYPSAAMSRRMRQLRTQQAILLKEIL